VLLFVYEAAEALGIDPAIIAGPCLAALAGCIGNRRRIIVKPGWTEACVLWVAIVLRSGGKKTPAMSLVLEHLQEREAQEIKAEEERRAELEKWKAALNSKHGKPPEEPEPAMRLLVSDITTEALLAVHARAPFGLLLHRDELGGWLRSYNQYKGGGRGADAQTWSEMHQGRPALIDRKGSPTLSVPRAAVSIIGGIQPELVRETLAGEHLVDGIASRILFIAPPEGVTMWTEETVSDDAREGWESLLEELLALKPEEDGAPVDLPMTEEAKAAWIRYYNDHAQRETDAEGPFRSALSKLKAATARLALMVQLADDPESTEVDVAAMRSGIALSEWFEGQAQQLYAGLEENEQERDRRAVYDWIAKQGGSTTKRDLARLGPLRFRGRAEEVLADLVAAGLAKPPPQSGHRGEKYVLCDSDGEAQ